MTKAAQKYPRFDTDTKAKVRVFGASNWSEVKLVNISKGGACVISPIPFTKTCIIEVVVTSPNPDIRMHNFMARVIWSEGQRFGIQFLSRL